MRLLSAITVVVVLITGTVSAAPKSVVSFQPLGLLIGLANVEYEYAFAPKTSFALRADVMYLKGTTESDFESEDVKYTGFGGGGSLRFYPLASAPKRVYGGFDLDIVQVNGEIEQSGETGSATMFSVGAVIGYKWLIADALAIALDVGTQYFAGSMEIENDKTDLAGLRPKVGFYVGLAF